MASGDNFVAFGVRFLRANVRNVAFGVRFLRASVINAAFGDIFAEIKESDHNNLIS